ncbi:hypothetical protein GCM10023185_33410 [Hymenobacter saemangeumensis]|uniref:Uncharacterized protein n=1 Tax=Hymenobacter saemangeumensis TaxID=1084522 RepID=A0ABP8INA3_9BACT
MKYLLISILSASAFLTACKNDNEAAADTLQQVAQAAANSPEAKARQAAWKLATTRPIALPVGSPANLRPAVEQLLPKEGYLKLISVKQTGAAQPGIMALPVLWRHVKADYPTVAPGYRLPFEAVLEWRPTGYAKGEKVPAALALRTPVAPDTLGTFALLEPGATIPGQSEQTPTLVKPGQGVTVQGVLYAYATTPNAGQQPSLILYPYQNPLGLPDPRKMVYLPL